jgi:acidic leucine-rich nuclear phosphoprotein 32 family protein A/C/D
LSDLDLLVRLDLTGNDITKVENYRDEVFKALPKLQVLDGFDRDGQQIESDDDDDEDDLEGEYGEEGE